MKILLTKLDIEELIVEHVKSVFEAQGAGDAIQINFPKDFPKDFAIEAVTKYAEEAEEHYSRKPGQKGKIRRVTRKSALDELED